MIKRLDHLALTDSIVIGHMPRSRSVFFSSTRHSLVSPYPFLSLPSHHLNQKVVWRQANLSGNLGSFRSWRVHTLTVPPLYLLRGLSPRLPLAIISRKSYGSCNTFAGLGSWSRLMPLRHSSLRLKDFQYSVRDLNSSLQLFLLFLKSSHGFHWAQICVRVNNQLFSKQWRCPLLYPTHTLD